MPPLSQPVITRLRAIRPAIRKVAENHPEKLLRVFLTENPEWNDEQEGIGMRNSLSDFEPEKSGVPSNSFWPPITSQTDA